MEEIIREESRRAKRRVTLKDVAAAAGVHTATASRAMGNSPLIPEATRKAVQDAARKLGYERDPMLQALVAYRKSNAPMHYHGTIAWMLTDQHTDEYMYKGIKENLSDALRAAKPLGYQIEEFRIGDQPPGKVLRQLAARGITGILFPSQREPGTRLEIDLSGFAAVRVGETLESPKLNSVHPNQYGNTMMLCENLRAAGWRRIGFYLPKVIDWRTAGTFSAAYWRWQQNQPVSEHCEVGLPEDFEDAHFAEWFRSARPEIIVGMPSPLEGWMKKHRIKPVPVVFPGNIGGSGKDPTCVDENWAEIYLAAVRLLDSMLRHGERGVPEFPRRIVINGRYLPGRWGRTKR